jgi:mRNA-degrading endonuclease toxin of MazEF toxin-antitoxin module
VSDLEPATPVAPFIVRGYPTDVTLPPHEEPFSRFGPALDRAIQMASSVGLRSAVVTDANNMVYAQLNQLWAVPRELR